MKDDKMQTYQVIQFQTPLGNLQIKTRNHPLHSTLHLGERLRSKHQVPVFAGLGTMRALFTRDHAMHI